MKKSLRIIFLLSFLLFTTEEVFSQEYYFISEISVIGNKKTKPNIITRELPFKRGDVIKASLLDELIAQGSENITNLSLFNSVSVSKVPCKADFDSKYHDAQINIVVAERWYYWPRIGIRLEERNFSSWIKKPDWQNITLETGFTINNISGQDQTLKTVLTSGFNKGFVLDYSNLSLDKPGKHFLGFNFTRKYSRVENIYTQNNEPLYIKSDTSFLTSRYAAFITYTFRQKLRLRHQFKLKFTYTELDPAVLKHNLHYWGSKDLNRRGYSFEYDFTLDERNNIQYPLTGYYIFTGITAYVTNKTDVKYIQIKGDYHYYAKLFNRSYLSARVQCALSKSNVNGYIFDKAIGYENVSLRGYELYVADGQHYLVFSPTAKYNFLPKTYYNLKFLSFLPRFNKIHLALYGKIYSDIGYAWNKHPTVENKLSNKLLQSWGVGVDLVSYYDITLSTDYSFNKLGKHGFFVSLKAPLR
ncbi:MAG: POTRA domain-containing protein [Bacteroidales bacterium]